MNVFVQAAYGVSELKSVAELRQMFPAGKADDLNFVLFGTSGTHGTYTSLEEVAASLETDEPESLTVLVIQPRTVRLLYGHLEVTPVDLPFLRKLDETSRAVLLQYAA